MSIFIIKKVGSFLPVDIPHRSLGRDTYFKAINVKFHDFSKIVINLHTFVHNNGSACYSG